MSSRTASKAPERPVSRSPEPAFNVVESKLSPPLSLSDSVSRTGLLEDLVQPRPEPVVLVSAPAGYGKTTLLAQWASQSRRPCAWVTIDRFDNDPVVLLAGIATALDRAVGLDPQVFEELSTPGVSVDAALIPRFAAALESIRDRFLLVLDDVHELSNPQSVDAIDNLLEQIPDGSQIALSGRVQPFSRIGSLRTRGLAFELGQTQLSMKQEEASELFASADVSMSDAGVAELTDRTEGWPAGLYLGALSIRGGAAMGRNSSFGGDDRFVADYLKAELLSTMPTEELEFLSRTSVLERLSAPLCDFVLETTGSGTILERLETKNLFVVPLDRNRRGYRYHRLFREMLRAELERAEPELAPRLLERASEWSSENEESDAAMAYAQAAGSAERVTALVLSRAQIEYRRGRAATVEGWLDWLEQSGDLDQNPLVAILGAWFSALRGQADRAERWTDIAERAMVDSAAGDQRTLIEGWLAVVHSVRGGNGVARIVSDAEFAVERFPRAGEWWLTGILILGIARVVAGDHQAADRLFEDTAESSQANEAWNGASLALAERALLAIDEGDWSAAETLAEKAEWIVRSSRMEEYPPNALVYAALARVAVHRRESKRAEELLTRAQRLRPQLTRVVALLSIQVRLVLAEAYAGLADPAGARTMLREAAGLMSGGSGFGTLEDRAEQLSLRLKSAEATAPGASTLTAAELRLLPMLPTQLSFREIGDRLYLSRHTVKSQAMSIYRKLEVTSRTGAVDCARDIGLI